ncbi:MAG TPA: acyl-CoA dehydrogenase [Burkholderiaceae bacterium]|nr:acyl-CoA dehydrogenase [Burkholderiaceae bacterium]
MDLNYSEEQTLLRHSVERFVAERYDFATRRRIAALPNRFDEPTWRAMAEFGWLALPLPQAHGGLDGSAVDVGIVAEGLGRGLVLEPFVSSVVLGGGLLARLGGEAQRARWLPQLAAGRWRPVFAHLEPGQPAGAVPALRATVAGSGWRLDGRKAMAFDAPSADAFLVSARLGDDDAGREGARGSARIAVFVVPRGTAGIAEQRFELVDGRCASQLEFAGCELPADALLDGPSAADAGAAIDEALDHATAAMCAEAVGCMTVLLDATVAYTKTRVQFGQPIAANQVLKHRMVDMATHCEESRAIALRAALRCDMPGLPAAERARAVSGAKLKIAQGARFVGENAVQLHGAMGVTDELNVGAYLKRLVAFETMWGTTAEHMARCVALRRAA